MRFALNEEMAQPPSAEVYKMAGFAAFQRGTDDDHLESIILLALAVAIAVAVKEIQGIVVSRLGRCVAKLLSIEADHTGPGLLTLRVI